MVNLEYNLTVDDLIQEYMIYKVNNGYEPQFSMSEFISFLYFFTSKMPVEDLLFEKEKLFRRFFERKAESDWLPHVPHMDMIYSEDDGDYIIKANYHLGYPDKKVRDERFTKIIDGIIGEYLSEYPKRKIDETIDIDDNFLMTGKYTTVEIVRDIWNSYISEQIKHHKWPEQCKDIDKYLFEMDLAEIIELKSIKKELLDFYEVISRRIAILYKQDKNLIISSNDLNGYLALANYELLASGYQKTFGRAFGRWKSKFDIDLGSSIYRELHTIYVGEEDELKIKDYQIGNDIAKKLVKTFDKNIQNN